MALIDSLRQAYPMYSDKSDDDLVQGYMNKYHPDKSIDEVESLLEQRQAQPEVQEQPTPDPDPEYEGVAQEFFEGVGSGLIGIPQGILELGASVVDLAADTDYASSVTDAANKLREAAGIDPVGLVGKGTEVITQFVIPGLGAASAVSKVSKFSKAGRLRKAVKDGQIVTKQTPTTLRPAAKSSPTRDLTQGEKLALGAQQVAAAGLADAVVATDGITTIGDFFEGGPTQTNQEIGLSGREEALRRLGNKLKVGFETGTIATVAPVAIAGTVAATGKVLTETPILREAVRGTATGVRSAGRKVSEGLQNIEARRALGQQQNIVANKLADIASVFRYRGFMPEEVAEARLLVTGQTDAIIKTAKNILGSMDKEINKVLKEADKVSNGASPLTKQSMFNNIEEFMTAPTQQMRDRAIAELPDNVAEQAKNMRGLIQSLNKNVLESDFLKRMDDINSKEAARLRGEINKNINTYLRRRYQSFEVKNYTPTNEAFEKGVVGFQQSPAATLEELSKIINKSNVPAERQDLLRQFGMRETMSPELDKGLIFEFVDPNNISRAAAERAAKNFLENNTRKVGSGKLGNSSRVADHRINAKLFASRANLPKFKRELLGEITDPKESFLGTVADLAEFKAVDDYFSRIRLLATQRKADGSLANPGIAQLFRDTTEMTPAQRKELTDSGYKILDPDTTPQGTKLKLDEGDFGSLRGFAVPDKIAQDLTRLVIGDQGVLGNAIRSTYSGFLRVKGATQFGKTVLSPITQLRNVTTASLFALAQGNIGRGANLGESVRLVYDNLFTGVAPEQAARTFSELQELGIIGTQAQLRELQDLIQKGFGYGVEEINGIPVGRKFGSKFTDNQLGAFVGNLGKKAENLYQAGDDIWKIYNFDFELNKLKNAYRKAGLTDDAIVADLVKRRGITVTGEETAERLLREEAARIVRNTVPNYNMAPEAIRTLRRAPVGNFIAFPYEILRTGANTIARGVDELASEIPEIRQIGLRRLTGAITTFGALPAGMSALAYELSGVSEEKMKAYQRSLAPSWEKNARLLPTGIDKETGLPTYINYSYSNPYDMLEKIAIAAINKAEEGRLQGLNGAQITAKAANASLSELFAPFTEEAIITAKIRDVLDPDTEVIGFRQAGQFLGGRGGQTQTGARVYNPEDSAGDRLAKSFAHILDGLLPSVIPVDVRSGELEASRFARGFVNGLNLEETVGISSVDRMKRERELSSELARAFTGITEMPIEPTGLKFRGYELAEARKNANNIFTAVSNRANATPQDFINAYRAANEANFKVQRELYNVIQDMKTLGLSDRQIRKQLKAARISGSGLSKVRRGKFDPVDISQTVNKNIRDNELRSVFPRKELLAIRKEYRNKPLAVETKEPQPEASVEPVQQQSVAATATPPAVAQAGAAPAQTTAAPAPTSQPQSSGGILPLLSGGNPIDALKNLQIFQRTQQ